MSGRARMPGGEPRKASQRNTRPAAPKTVRVVPVWRPGDQVRWQGRVGSFRRYVGDDVHAEVVSGERVYRVRVADCAEPGNWEFGRRCRWALLRAKMRPATFGAGGARFALWVGSEGVGADRQMCTGYGQRRKRRFTGAGCEGPHGSGHLMQWFSPPFGSGGQGSSLRLQQVVLYPDRFRPLRGDWFLRYAASRPRASVLIARWQPGQ